MKAIYCDEASIDKSTKLLLSRTIFGYRLQNWNKPQTRNVDHSSLLMRQAKSAYTTVVSVLRLVESLSENNYPNTHLYSYFRAYLCKLSRKILPDRRNQNMGTRKRSKCTCHHSCKDSAERRNTYLKTYEQSIVFAPHATAKYPG